MKDPSVWRSTSSCQDSAGSRSETKGSISCIYLRTIGYGEILGLKPAKTMYQEQKDQLAKKEEKGEDKVEEK